MGMMTPQEFDFNYSLYISSEEEEGRRELAVRPANKDALIKLMRGLKLEGEWRIMQTACGLIVSFKREADLLVFQELDLSGALGVPAVAYSFSALETYRQKLLIRDVPWVVSTREVEASLSRQGVTPLSITRTRQGNVMLEIGEPTQFNNLLQDGFDFFGSGRFATMPVPGLPPPPPTPPHPSMPVPHRESFFGQRDTVLQCYKCQGFWHYAAQCPSSQRCVRCGDGHPVTECPRPRNDPVCVHCSGRHHAAYKQCPVRLQMKTFLPMVGPSYMQPYMHSPGHLPYSL